MKIRAVLFSVVLLLTACAGGSDRPTASSSESVQTQFLAENAAREEVTVTASGLQYEVLRAAEGAKPSAQSNITVHYKGELIDGTEFDSSYARGEPATFDLGGTIQGWVEGVQLMSVGSQYRFVIPANLAYGDNGAGEFIMPGDTLVFEVELLEINSP